MIDDDLNIGFMVLQRRTFHECASELSSYSKRFRDANCNQSLPDDERKREMADCSTRGTEVLKILALSIRNDQDEGRTELDHTPVGAVLSGVRLNDDVSSVLQSYNPPWNSQQNFEPIDIRKALNKIAHASPTESHFYADESQHDLLLTGKYWGKSWIAIVSIPKLCEVIMALPDARTEKE